MRWSSKRVATSSSGLVRFVLTIGGYYDLEAVITFFTTGRYREAPDASWRYRRSNAYGKWVFLRSNAWRVAAARDRVLLDAMATRKLHDLNADIGDLIPRLGAEGRAAVEQHFTVERMAEGVLEAMGS